MNKLKKMLARFLSVILLVAMLSTTASAYYGYHQAYASSSYSWWADLGASTAYNYITFSPSTTGYYSFYSDSKSYGDPYGYLVSPSYYSTVLNSLGNAGCANSTASAYSLAYDDDSNGNGDFRFDYQCYAGQTYYFIAAKHCTPSTYGIARIGSPSYYSVTLNRDGGSGGSASYYNYNSTAWLASNSSSSTSYISPPTRQDYVFTGYYTGRNSTGTRCIESNGYLNSNAYRSGTLYAGWQQNIYTLTFNNQGVPSTTSTITAGSSIPANVTVPTRIGYNFNGYYSAAAGGTQHYSPNGALTSALTMSGNNTLYAQWSPAVFSISYEGMDGATMSPQPTTHTYNTATTIPAPSRTDGYNFTGWVVNGGSVKEKNLTLSATGYTAEVTLKANWVKQTDAEVENPDGILTSDNISQEDLNKIFENPVGNSADGVTQDELNSSDSVKLSLKVANIAGSVSGEEDIKNATNGEVVKFFDVSVTKEVTKGADVTTTELKEVPQPIEIRIPLSGDMANKSSYQVLRYHTYTEVKDGEDTIVAETHQIDNDTGKGEYFTADGNELVLHTRLFSTYAIAAGQSSVVADGALGEGANTPKKEFDVQARVSQNDINAIYKIDVSWGPMVFAYTTSRQWDPNNHIYMGASYDWAPTSFEGGNNEISLASHSNADVNVDFSFMAEPNQLTGVDVSFREVNSDTAPMVNRYFLPKVPQESAAAPEIQSYLWLQGTPTTLPAPTPPSGGESDIAKVGVISVTISADQNPILTPKN